VSLLRDHSLLVVAGVPNQPLFPQLGGVQLHHPLHGAARVTPEQIEPPRPIIHRLHHHVHVAERGEEAVVRSPLPESQHLPPGGHPPRLLGEMLGVARVDGLPDPRGGPGGTREGIPTCPATGRDGHGILRDTSPTP